MSEAVKESMACILRRIRDENLSDSSAKSALLLSMIHLEVGKFNQAEMAAIQAASFLGSLSGKDIVSGNILLRGKIIEYAKEVRKRDPIIANELESILKG